MGGGQGSATTPAMAKGKHTRTTDWFSELPRKHLRTTHAGGTLVRETFVINGHQKWTLARMMWEQSNISPEIQPRSSLRSFFSVRRRI